jgi:hypothetical protein
LICGLRVSGRVERGARGCHGEGCAAIGAKDAIELSRACHCSERPLLIQPAFAGTEREFIDA